MSWLTTPLWVIRVLFPFLKEVFLGKDNPHDPDNPLAQRLGQSRKIKKIIIGLACGSLLLNFYGGQRFLALANEHVRLQRQYQEALDALNGPKAQDSAPPPEQPVAMGGPPPGPPPHPTLRPSKPPRPSKTASTDDPTLRRLEQLQ